MGHSPAPRGVTPPPGAAEGSGPAVAVGRGGREITPPPRRPPQKRGNPDTEKIAELTEKVRVLQAQLDSAFAHMDDVDATAELKDELIQVRIESSQLRDLVARSPSGSKCWSAATHF